MGFDASVQPTNSALVSITQSIMVLEAPVAVGGHAFAEAHNFFGITGRRAIVKRHDDVRADVVLHFHRSLGTEINPRTIDDGSKAHTILTKSIDVRHRIGLVPPRVRQDGTGPTHELMTAPSCNRRIAGSKHQVIRVVQNDLRSRLGNLVRPKTFHTRLGANRHKRRRIKRTVRGFHPAQSRTTLTASGFNLKPKRSAHCRSFEARLRISFSLVSTNAGLFG